MSGNRFFKGCAIGIALSLVLWLAVGLLVVAVIQ